MAIEIDFTEIAQLQEQYKSCKSLKETYALADVLNEKYGIDDTESYPILSGVYSLSNIISVLNKATPKTECVTKTSALVTLEDIAYVSAAQSEVQNLTVPEFCALVGEFTEKFGTTYDAAVDILSGITDDTQTLAIIGRAKSRMIEKLKREHPIPKDVVYCCECKFRTKETRWTREGFCDKWNNPMQPARLTDFCSYGEREKTKK